MLCAGSKSNNSDQRPAKQKTKLSVVSLQQQQSEQQQMKSQQQQQLVTNQQQLTAVTGFPSGLLQYSDSQQQHQQQHQGLVQYSDGQYYPQYYEYYDPQHHHQYLPQYHLAQGHHMQTVPEEQHYDVTTPDNTNSNVSSVPYAHVRYTNSDTIYTL